MTAAHAILIDALALSMALGVLHALLLRPKREQWVAFVGLAGLAHVLVGLALTWSSLAALAAGSAWTAPWFALVSLGFFASGVALALAWLGVVKGTAAWWAVAGRPDLGDRVTQWLEARRQAAERRAESRRAETPQRPKAPPRPPSKGSGPTRG